MEERESDLKNILVEIDELNKKLNILLEQKLVNEEWISETYTFLHRLLGGEIIEKLDEKYSR